MFKKNCTEVTLPQELRLCEELSCVWKAQDKVAVGEELKREPLIH